MRLKLALSFPFLAWIVACSRSETVPRNEAQAAVEREAGPSNPQDSPRFDAGRLDPVAGGPRPGPVRYEVPERTQAEVDEGLRQACEVGKASGKPLLIEFSAPWCGDCRRLAEMKGERVLADRLSSVPHFALNIGRFDRHEEMLEKFDIHSIAAWRVVGTENCNAPPHTWRRIAARTLEPATGKKVDAEALTTWLDTWF